MFYMTNIQYWLSNLYCLTKSVYSIHLVTQNATKLHACFFRKYVKGRDYYDLIWYLGKGIEPNYILLNNAIQQTEGINLKIGVDTLKAFMQKKLGSVDFNLVRRDVERFLEDKSELKMLDKDIMLKMIQ